MGSNTEVNIRFPKDLHDAVAKKLDGNSLGQAYASAMRQIIQDPLWLTQGNFYRSKSGIKKEAYPVETFGINRGEYADALGATIDDMFSNALARHMRIDLGQWPEQYEKTTLSHDAQHLHALLPEQGRKIVPGGLSQLQADSQNPIVPDLRLELKRGESYFRQQLEALRREGGTVSKQPARH